jgi:hypothetical protein
LNEEDIYGTRMITPDNVIWTRKVSEKTTAQIRRVEVSLRDRFPRVRLSEKVVYFIYME